MDFGTRDGKRTQRSYENLTAARKAVDRQILQCSEADRIAGAVVLDFTVEESEKADCPGTGRGQVVLPAYTRIRVTERRVSTPASLQV